MSAGSSYFLCEMYTLNALNALSHLSRMLDANAAKCSRVGWTNIYLPAIFTVNYMRNPVVFNPKHLWWKVHGAGVVTNYPTGGVFVVLGGNLGFSVPTSTATWHIEVPPNSLYSPTVLAKGSQPR